MRADGIAHTDGNCHYNSNGYGNTHCYRYSYGHGHADCDGNTYYKT